MPKSSQREFDAQLNRLSSAWTYNLKSHFWPKPGKGKTQSKRLREQIIHRLQTIAERYYLPSTKGRQTLRIYDSKKQWHPRRGKGWGREAKRDAFKIWYRKNFQTENCVYVFWSNRKCLYVGRTGVVGGGRPTRHFEKYWFGGCTRIDVYGFRNKRSVAKYECLLTHKYKPTKARSRPAASYYASNCPICSNNKFIARQIRSLYPVRTKRRKRR